MWQFIPSSIFSKPLYHKDGVYLLFFRWKTWHLLIFWANKTSTKYVKFLTSFFWWVGIEKVYKCGEWKARNVRNHLITYQLATVLSTHWISWTFLDEIALQLSSAYYKNLIPHFLSQTHLDSYNKNESGIKKICESREKPL